MEKGFFALFENLNWKVSEEDQEEAVAYFADLVKCSPQSIRLVAPTVSRSCLWHNEARVICAQDDYLLERHLHMLFNWLVDINWPGAEAIFDRLAVMDSDVVDTELQVAKDWALASGAARWYTALDELSEERNKRTLH